MFFFVAGIAVAVILFVILGFQKTETGIRFGLSKKQAISLLGLMICAGSCFVSVPTGHTGILTTFGKIENATLEAGVHFKLPYQKVVVMDNRAQKASIDMMCFSSDIQEVSISYSMNYQIRKENAQDIYKAIGANYYEVIMEPRIQEAVKSVCAQYSADNLIAQRASLSNEITEILTKELEEYNIIVLNTAIENMDFSDVFTDAVEAKQVAEQEKLKASIEQEQLNIEASAAAEREVIAAEAEAEVTRIQAEVAQYAGEREAEMNRKLAENLTEELVEYYYANKWDGALPKIVGSDTVLPILKSSAPAEE